MDNLWQSPYVNVFKHFNVPSWKKASKEGDVVSLMDKTVKGTVFKISGCVPASNYILLPKTNSQSLGLTGRYFYLLFKPAPSKHFVVHLDVVTTDNLTIRVSFSNLFKTFKSTATWLQFPFICSPSHGHMPSYAADAARDQSGPAPMITRWSILCLDLHHTLSMYLNRRFLYLKSMRLCANMMVKNVFTSDTMFEPGLSMDDAKREGLTSQGICPLPRDMSYPVAKGDHWRESYDLIRFPSDSSKKPFDAMQISSPKPKFGKSAAKSDKGGGGGDPQRVQPRTVDVSKCVSDRVSMIQKITGPKEPPKYDNVTKELPELDSEWTEPYDDDVHVYAHPEERRNGHSKNQTLKSRKGKYMRESQDLPRPYKSLEPDPILKLKKIVGFGGATNHHALWSSDGSSIIYPCHAVIVQMKIATGQQQFFIGHTDKVSCLSVTNSNHLLASGQTGNMSTVRIWKLASGECLALGKAHAHSLASISFSSKGAILCGVGKDGHGKNMVVIWNTSKVFKHRELSIIAKAHTDVDISRIVVAPFDETKIATCGQDNIRVWRVKDGSLRSAPVALGEYSSIEFTDICFEVAAHPDSEPESRLFYACTKSGLVFAVDYSKLSVRRVRRLLPIKNTGEQSTKLKAGQNSGGAISINSMHLNETFCVTGSDDGYLRLWPLDFAYVYLEAAHEGPVTAARLSSDGLKILAGTSTGNLGVLDVPSRQYTTLMRSHTGRVSCFSVDPQHQQLVTVSEDRTIRVWDLNTLQQLYDFSSQDECPCTVMYHPHQQVLACGFLSGVVRIISVEKTCLLAEHRQLRGQVTGLVYSPDGSRLYSCCSLGIAALYDATTSDYMSVRVVAGLVARGTTYAPQALVVSPCGRRVAFAGPTEYTLTIADAAGLDELVRVDVSSLSAASVDSVLRLAFSPTHLGHLLVATSNNRLLKIEVKTGKMVYEGTHIHRSDCSAVSVSGCGQYLATGGDKTIKIWDYAMSLDINFQVFIGHSENVSKIHFNPDGMGLITSGEAIYMWDMLVKRAATPPIEGRMLQHVIDDMDNDLGLLKMAGDSNIDPPYKQSFPRGKGFKSISPRSDDIDALSSIHGGSDADEAFPTSKSKAQAIVIPGNARLEDSSSGEAVTSNSKIHDVRSVKSSSKADVRNHYGEGDSQYNYPRSVNQNSNKQRTDAWVTHRDQQLQHIQSSNQRRASQDVFHEPSAFVHYKPRQKLHGLSKRRYTAPPNQAGLNLRSVIGYNCNGRNNMVWYPDTGFFAYTAGCIIVIEDLNSGGQKYLQGHTEEVSCLALQHDCQVLVSANAAFQQDSPCHISVWNIQTQTCRRVLSHHRHSVQCMAFSRDDCFLVSIGDYRECLVVVWETKTFEAVESSSAASAPIHFVSWDPFTVNEFLTVGEDGSVLFWLLDESQGYGGDGSTDYCLSLHEAELPAELAGDSKHPAPSLTSVAYGGDNVVFVGTDTGKVLAWDTSTNACFMHWEADTSEITMLVCRHPRLMTAGYSSNALRLWAVGGISDMKDNQRDRHQQHKLSGLTMEDEMILDGAVTCAQFDDMLDMGIIGTEAGTLWYINWAERTSIRLVSGHKNKITGVTFSPSNLLLTGGDDGSVRVWSLKNREQALQFQVLEQSCTCLASWAASTSNNNICLPIVAGGYSDGTVRVFNITKVEMVLKMKPHAVTVTAIVFSADGAMILSGGSDGLIAVSSPTTGMTVRVISDHKGVAISSMDAALTKDFDVGVTAPTLWLSCSMDRRVSIWAADWSKDFNELVDWLTFPAPPVMPDGSKIKKNDTSHFYQLPPTLAKFSPDDVDTIVYTGYGMEKSVNFYSLTQHKVVRTINLTHWALCLDVSPDSSLITVGGSERLLKLLDYHEGNFQDFTGHSGEVTLTRFSQNGASLITVSHNEIFLWDVQI